MAAAAVFEAIDTNHDGVISKEEFEAAVAPAGVTEVVTVPAATYVVQPETYAAAPVESYTYAAPEIVYESPLTYTEGAIYTVGETTTVLTLSPGTRVKYTARHDGQQYPGVVTERSVMGWILQLDVDGGLKEVADAEVWRLTLEEAVEEAATKDVTAAVSTKVKKVKKSKGCC